MNSTAKTISFWFVLLVTAILLYQIVRRTGSAGAVIPSVPAKQKIQYAVTPVGTSVEDIRTALESSANEGWEFAAPVIHDGTTTALIFKRQKR